MRKETSPGGMIYVHVALSKTGDRSGTWPEWVVAAVAGVGRLGGN